MEAGGWPWTASSRAAGAIGSVGQTLGLGLMRGQTLTVFAVRGIAERPYMLARPQAA
ncbi:MAG TPA: hypothetical protein VGM50_21985 [Gemmatimonadaceae bacterium]